MVLAILAGSTVIAVIFAAAAYLDTRHLERRIEALEEINTPLDELLDTYKHVVPEWFDDTPPRLPHQRGPT